MKFISAMLLTLILHLSLSNVAHAHNAACLENRAGGFIVLTNKVAPESQGWYIVFSSASSGETFYGEWAIIGERTVMITWIDGRTSAFDISAFKPCTY